MFKKILNLTKDSLSQTRNEFWVLVTFLFVYIASAIFYTVSLLQTEAWQLRIVLAINLLLIVIAIIGLWLLRIGRGTTCLLLNIGSLALTFPIMPTLIAGGIGVLFGLVTMLASVLIAGLLSRQYSRQVILAGIVSGLLSILIDLFWPFSRLVIPSLQIVIIILSVVALAADAGLVVRQFRNYSLRTKLVIAFIVIAIGSVGSVSYIVDRSLRTNRANDIGSNLSVLSNAEAIQVGQVVENDFNLLNGLALNQAVQDRAELGTQEDNLTQAEINQLDLEWRAADAANNNADPLVAKVLDDELSAELIKFQKKFPEHVEVFLTDLPGVSIATTDRTSDYLQSDEDWWQIAYKNGQYIGQPEYDASSKVLAINMAVPVRSRSSNQIVGVLRTTVNINSLSNVLISGLFGKTGRTDIYLPDGQVVKLNPTGNGNYEISVVKTTLNNKAFNQPSQKYQSLSLDGIPSLVSATSVSVSGDSNQNNIISNLGWQVVVHQDQAEALKPVETQTQNDLLLAIIVTILAAIAAVGLAQVLASPIIRLNAVAEKGGLRRSGRGCKGGIR